MITIRKTSAGRQVDFFLKSVLLMSLWVGIFGLTPADCGQARQLREYLGDCDSLLLTRCGDNRVVFEKNSHTPLIPASIIKIMTGLLAFHCLGEEFRFKTDFFLTPDGDLVVKGYGDPAFTSEEIRQAAKRVAEKIERIGDVVVDDSFFAPIEVPGRTTPSLNPYNSPNGALCANFNTVAFVREKGIYRSTEPETPLLPFAEKRLRRMPVSRGRVLLINEQADTALYAGELTAFFLAEEGCPVEGGIRRGRVDPDRDRLICSYRSGHTLAELVAGLLFYSSNFSSNQLLLACGARQYGPPATLEAGLRALQRYLERELDIKDARLEEGAGLSRSNRVSAVMMDKALVAFLPYRDLMRRDDENDFYKTGNLTGVNTRVGYIFTPAGGMVRYVVMINTPGRTVAEIMPAIKKRARDFDPGAASGSFAVQADRRSKQ